MRIHTVKDGETLYEISKKYGINLSKIIENNGLSNPDRLSVGQKLLILTPTRTYTIRGGDTLPKVAARFNVSEKALRRFNPYLSIKDMTYPEQVIAIKYDIPRHGTILFNGYYYKGVPDKRLKLALAYTDYVTVSAYKQEGDGIDCHLEDKEIITMVKTAGSLPIMRIYFPSGFDSFSAHSDKIIKSAVETALSKGYSGITVAAYKAYTSDGFANFLLDLKRELMLNNLTLYLECDGKNEQLCDIADGSVLMYEKCNLDSIPTFKDGEKKTYTDFATDCDSTKCYIDISPFAYIGNEPLTHSEAHELAYRTGREIKYDKEKRICFFDYKRLKSRHVTDYKVNFESLENTKAKLDIVAELGFMGVSFDIMRVPTANLMMAAATFGARPSYSSADI